MSSASKDEYQFIDNQKKKLVILKNIAERLHGKQITENCFALDEKSDHLSESTPMLKDYPKKLHQRETLQI